MKKYLGRLLLFFLGIPVLLGVVILLPHKNHLCLNLLVILFCVLGALEFQNILTKKNLFVPRVEAAILGALVPALAAAGIYFDFSIMGVPVVFMIAVSWLLLSRIFSPTEKQDLFIGRIAAGFSLLLYPGVFLTWIIAMSLLPESSIVIIVYLLMVFMNDSAAWAVGLLFGKNNRNVIPASPNKSIAGFAGGLAASILAGVGAVLLFPDVFSSRFPPVPAAILLGLLTGIASILGDLGESVLKRSAGLKDSGVLMPGRGGVLDSVDSLAFAAPVFYLAYRLIFAG